MNHQKTPDDAHPKGAPDVIAAPVGSETKANLPLFDVGIGASAGGLQALEEFFENVAIDKAHERVQGVLEQMPTAVIILDPTSGHLQYANRKATGLFGTSLPSPAPEGSGVPFQPSLSGTRSGGQAYLAEEWPLARTLATGEIISDEEIEVIGVDKIIRVFSVSSAPVRNANGAIIAVVGTFLDITQRRRSEESLAEVNQRLGLLVESAMDFAIITLDVNGKVVSWNSGAERILGWNEKEMVGRPADHDFHARRPAHAGTAARDPRGARIRPRHR